MGWRDDYQPGSFRGAPFVTTDGEQTGGRRVASHEFPRRDWPVTEDMGRRQRGFTVTAHVIGADYRAARDRLIEAMEASGPGTLVHPWRGQLTVVALDYSVSESTEEGGMARLQLTFAEAGLPDPAAGLARPDTAAVASALADAEQVAAPEAFARRFTLDGTADWVEGATVELVTRLSKAAVLAAALTGGAGPALRTFDGGLRLLPEGVARLARQPLILGRAIVGLATTLGLVGDTPRARSRALASVATAGDARAAPLPPAIAAPISTPTTPSRDRLATNEAAVLAVWGIAVAAERVRAAADTRFVSYEEAAGARDALAGDLDRLAVVAADAGDDDTAAAFDRLRRVTVRDLTARGGSLARLTVVRPAGTTPALALAHRLYGPAGLADRADAIVERNRVAHPGFVPAGDPLQVLSDGLTGGLDG